MTSSIKSLRSLSDMRSSLSITFSVWKAIFLREAVDRLFEVRVAWLWLLAEPALHIGFVSFIWFSFRQRTIGGIDTVIWVMVGMLAFFLFRRVGVQAMYAIDCNKALFVYRQVKPFDAAIVRAMLEAFLMSLTSLAILLFTALFGHNAVPDDPLLVMVSLFGLWLCGLGYGLTASVLMKLVPEIEHILNIIMRPMYILSGVILPIASVPQPYQNMLLFNPVAHGLEGVRQGFSSAYHAVPGLSINYLYGFALASVFLGMLLYRRFGVRLVTQ